MDDFIANVKCPHCHKPVMLTIDTVSGPQQQEPEERPIGPGLIRWCSCYQCRTHTEQVAVDAPGGGYKWKCKVCGHMAKKIWK